MTKKLLKNGLPAIKCPTCGKLINRFDLSYNQDACIYYDIEFDKKGEVKKYTERDRELDDGGTFYHYGEDSCDGLNPEEEQLLKITR